MVNSSGSKLTNIIKLIAILISLSLLLTGCADLKSISSLASISAETLKITTMVDDYPESAKRQKTYSQNEHLDKSIAESEEVRKETLAIYKTVSLYTSALGRLAANDLINYTDSVKKLQEQIDILKGSTSISPLAYKSVSFIAQVFTDTYRQGKLKRIIEASNEDYKAILSYLIEHDNRYIIQLYRETNSLTAFTRKKLSIPVSPNTDQMDPYFKKELINGHQVNVLDPIKTASMQGVDFLILDTYNQKLVQINAKIKATEQHIISLKKISSAHEELYKNINDLSAESLRTTLTIYYQEIYDIYLLLKKQ